jgi:hypothetical protein
MCVKKNLATPPSYINATWIEALHFFMVANRLEVKRALLAKNLCACFRFKP